MSAEFVRQPYSPRVPPPATSGADIERDLETYRPELAAYAYRMLGSAFEADDAVQETLLRAWRSRDSFQGRSTVRSWLYRIATNVCLDMLNGRNRRARPMELNDAGIADIALLGDPLSPETWVEPIPDDRIAIATSDPAEAALARESVRLAFVAALQHLPPRQRAVLILREVLRWRAAEVAQLLDTSVASVNSALQRARATLDTAQPRATDVAEPHDAAQQALLGRYVEAFEQYDMQKLTALLAEDAAWNMPPYALWLNTHEAIVGWCVGPGIGCAGSKLIRTSANGSPAYGQYKPAASGDGFEPWALQVLEIKDGKLAAVTFFLDTARLFPLFGLPDRLPG